MTEKEEILKNLDIELAEVNVKLAKLNEFLDKSHSALSITQLELLYLQRSAINTYAWALKARINDLKEA